MPRVSVPLRAPGLRGAKKRIARLMHTYGLLARLPRVFACTIDSEHADPSGARRRRE